MSAKHTAGPWRIDPDHREGMDWNNHIVSVLNPNMCICFMSHDGTPENEVGEANARLIAAAPDGLKAAKLAYLHILKTPHDRLRTKGQNVLCALRDFIASATGRDAEEVQNEFEVLAAKAKGE